jgi:hypothetical protein
LQPQSLQPWQPARLYHSNGTKVNTCLFIWNIYSAQGQANITSSTWSWFILKNKCHSSQIQWVHWLVWQDWVTDDACRPISKQLQICSISRQTGVHIGLLEGGGGGGGFRTISYRHELRWSCWFVVRYAVTAIEVDHIFIQFHRGLS